MSEQVMVFRTSLLESLGKFQGFSFNSRYTQLLLPNNLFFVDRAEAEVDPTLKQVIPYITIFNENNEVFVYQRTKKVGEQRLASRFSCGIGGHLNPIDGTDSPFKAALIRELDEEITVELDGKRISGAELLEKCCPSTPTFINDDSNEVGTVHFGLNLEIQLPEGSSIKLNEDSLTNGRFMDISQVAELDLEGWSRILVKSWGW